jgi:hypothetical protein
MLAIYNFQFIFFPGQSQHSLGKVVTTYRVDPTGTEDQASYRQGMQGFQYWHIDGQSEFSTHMRKIMRTDGQGTIHIKNPVTAPL